ncbi:MAG TPA: TetR family transcriptional regulator [Acidimicrobiales bacterium]|nr:TetR family transcriptional regulator [Acidimicrobiales bacterium]
MGGTETPSLRERNKARARAEIADAALRLFYERGFEGVTVEEIVNAAGVSRRTFFRYFETKEDALLAEYPELNARLIDTLEATGPDDSMEAIRSGLHQIADWYIERSEVVLARSKVIRETPTNLAARNLEFLTQWERGLADAVARQVGVDAGDLMPRTAAAIIVGAFRAALTQWVRSAGKDDFHVLTDRALDLIEHGLEGPLTRASTATGASEGTGASKETRASKASNRGD